MPLDFTSDQLCAAPAGQRVRRGKQAYLSGQSAEEQVARLYLAAGCDILETRWRGSRGEIDLIVEQAGVLVFVEVKSSRTHAQAAESLRPAQVRRLMQSGEEYAGKYAAGSLTDMRFDVALVDGIGRIDVIENALIAG